MNEKYKNIEKERFKNMTAEEWDILQQINMTSSESCKRT